MQQRKSYNMHQSQNYYACHGRAMFWREFFPTLDGKLHVHDGCLLTFYFVYFLYLIFKTFVINLMYTFFPSL